MYTKFSYFECDGTVHAYIRAWVVTRGNDYFFHNSRYMDTATVDTYDQLYEAPFADLQKRLHAESVLEDVDRDFVIRKRAAIAAALEAFINLSEAGKAEYVRQLNKLNSSDYSLRREAIDQMFETLQENRLRHPKHFDCPCCGFRSSLES